MNEKNLVSLKDRTEQERKEIASKGGLASARQRKEERALYKDIDLEQARKHGKELGLYDLIENYTEQEGDIILDYPHVVGHDKKGNELYSPYYHARGTIKEQIAINIVRHCLNYKDEEEKLNALKWTKLYKQIIDDKAKHEYKLEELRIKRELSLKELELKEKQLELEERKVKAREELIKMKNRGVIDVAINKEQELALNLQLNKELVKEYESLDPLDSKK